MPWVAYARGVRIAWGWTVRALAVLVAGVVCLSVGGCTGSEPKPTPSVTATSASPTPPASASVTIPDEAKAHTPEGGIAFAKFAVLEAGKAYATNETAAFESIARADCQGCASIVKGVKDQQARDERNAQVRMLVKGAQLFEPPTESTLVVDVVAVEQATSVVRASGEVVRALPEEPLSLRLGLVWNQGGWTLGEIKVVT